MPNSNPSSSAAYWVVGAAALVFALAAGYSATRADRAVPASPGAPVADSAAGRPPTVETLQRKTRATPLDVDAWGALGTALSSENRFAEAATAFERATTLAPRRADLWSALGEARVMGSPHDPMPPAALAAFRTALAIDPADPRSRYFAAVARDLKGDHRGAIDDWFALLAATPPGAPWESDLRRTIAQVGKINDIDVAARLGGIRAHPVTAAMPESMPSVPGPSPEQMRAAAALPPSQQDAMAQAMVAKLEARLKADPANVDGWMMLIRSRMTLGERAGATAALNQAVAANPGARTQLEAAAAALGVGR